MCTPLQLQLKQTYHQINVALYLEVVTLNIQARLPSSPMLNFCGRAVYVIKCNWPDWYLNSLSGNWRLAMIHFYNLTHRSSSKDNFVMVLLCFFLGGGVTTVQIKLSWRILLEGNKLTWEEAYSTSKGMNNKGHSFQQIKGEGSLARCKWGTKYHELQACVTLEFLWQAKKLNGCKQKIWFDGFRQTTLFGPPQL